MKNDCKNCKYEKLPLGKDPCKCCCGEYFEAKEICYICGNTIEPQEIKVYNTTMKQSRHDKCEKENKMDIKINYKDPLTEEEKREAITLLFVDVLNEKASQRMIALDKFTDKAIEICRNEPKEVESVEILYNIKDHGVSEWMVFSADEIREIQKIKL